LTAAKTGGARRPINLALQGGGAHGAFTWGVLDRLLDSDCVDLTGGWISGTSAGAINAAALASGLAVDGREGARATLNALWGGIAERAMPDLARLNPLLAGSIAGLGRGGTLGRLTRLFSPYELNPLKIDPLRDVLAGTIDFARVARAPGPELLIAATDVASGQARLFRRAELSLEVLLASACLPTLHHAVEIEGRHYWDGGFSANPELIALAAESPIQDTLIVQLAPLARDGVPRAASEIAHHVSHMTFTRPYIAQLETIARLQSGAAARPAGWLNRWRRIPPDTEGRIAAHRFHLIEAGRFTGALRPESIGTPDATLFAYLFHAGRETAAKWLEREAPRVGTCDTADFAGRLAALRARAAPQAANDEAAAG
jgi:NTE family protein